MNTTKEMVEIMGEKLKSVKISIDEHFNKPMDYVQSEKGKKYAQWLFSRESLLQELLDEVRSKMEKPKQAVIIKRGRKEDSYQLMQPVPYGFKHIFAGKLFTLNEAFKIAEENYIEVLGVAKDDYVALGIVEKEGVIFQ